MVKTWGLREIESRWIHNKKATQQGRCIRKSDGSVMKRDVGGHVLRL